MFVDKPKCSHQLESHEVITLVLRAPHLVAAGRELHIEPLVGTEFAEVVYVSKMPGLVIYSTFRRSSFVMFL